MNNFYDSLTNEQKIKIASVGSEDPISSIFDKEYLLNYSQIKEINQIFIKDFCLGNDIDYLFKIQDWAQNFKSSLLSYAYTYWIKSLDNNLFICHFLLKYVQENSYHNFLKSIDYYNSCAFLLSKSIFMLDLMENENNIKILNYKEKIKELLKIYNDIEFSNTVDKEQSYTLFLVFLISLFLKNNHISDFTQEIFNITLKQTKKLNKEFLQSVYFLDTFIEAHNMVPQIHYYYFFQSHKALKNILCDIFTYIGCETLNKYIHSKMKFINFNNKKCLNYFYIIQTQNLFHNIDKDDFISFFNTFLLNDSISLNEIITVMDMNDLKNIYLNAPYLPEHIEKLQVFENAFYNIRLLEQKKSYLLSCFEKFACEAIILNNISGKPLNKSQNYKI